VSRRARTSCGALFDDEKVLVYHCTRLLPHERDWIKAEGLLPLTAGLVERRIRAALAGGYLSGAEHHELLRLNVFARSEQDGRENQICVVAGRESFDDPYSGWESLLATWGGRGDLLHRIPNPDDRIELPRADHAPGAGHTLTLPTFGPTGIRREWRAAYGDVRLAARSP
jgi:hypothetical protein